MLREYVVPVGVHYRVAQDEREILRRVLAPVEAEKGIALRIQFVPVEARHGGVVAVPVVVAAARLRILVP